MQERRRYVRLNIPLELSYTLKGKEKIWHKTITKNISPIGARFTINQPLPKGTVLDIEVKIPTRSEPIPAQAKLVWSKEEVGQEKDVYDAGFELIHVSEDGKNAFFQYLCNLMYDQLKRID